MKPDRYHALDSLRGFAMLLGVVLHAAVSFMANPPPFWSVRDNSPSLVADVFLFAVHDFRMQLFFLLAGFFGCLLYERYGVAGTARHRIKRVAIPFVLAAVFIVPTVVAAFLYAEIDWVRTWGVPDNATRVQRHAAALVAANPEASNFAIVANRLAFYPLLMPAHLWFLYYLLLIYAAVLPAAPLVGRQRGTRVFGATDAAFRRLIEGRGRVLLPAVCTVPVLLAMKSPIADTPLGWAPEWHILFYYSGFFAFGWMLHRHRALVARFGSGWKRNLAVANVAVLPAALVLVFRVVEIEKDSESKAFAWRLGAFAAQALYTWLMIAGLWGAFLHWFAHASAAVRYLADASYWCYLASIPPTVAFQFVVKDWPLPGLVKWALVTAATLALLLASYEWCVRYTFVGAILNGRKYRKRAEAKERKPAAVEVRV